MNSETVVFSGSEGGDKPQISILYNGMPESMVKPLREHAWQLMARFYALSAEFEAEEGAGQ